MSSRSRYLLIAICITLFAILAPAVIFYSSGLVLDWKNKNLVKTGILAFRTEPKNPNVFLDNQLVNESETLRFLRPADYNLKFEATGYCTWQKRLQVTSGRVTWASPESSRIFLLKQNPPPNILHPSGDVKDFLYASGNLYVLTGSELQTTSVGGGNSKKTLLPFVGENLQLTDDGKKLLIKEDKSSRLGRTIVFDTLSGSISNISSLASSTAKIRGSQSTLFALEKNTLYNLDLKAQKKTALLSSVIDFALLEDNGYVLTASGTKSALLTFPLANPKITSYFAELPFTGGASIFVTSQKQVFVSSQNQLYQIGLQAKRLGAAEQIGFDELAPYWVTFFGGGEAYFFDFNENQAKLISRSGQNISNLRLTSDIGHAIWKKNNLIEAVELDTRDVQNTCLLYQGQNIEKFVTDQQTHRLFVLDSGWLKMVEIR